MPLEKSSSKAAVGRNIAREEAAGKPRKQAIAIALHTQRKAMGPKHSHEYGHDGEHSAGMGTDGGADGSHESTRHKTGKSIHTGHPDELERFHKGEKGAGRGS